ncbi:hypothetical protein WG908_14205 [Sphingobium sp. AN641]|uniref:hypothetical protein n=1 Tax=Sphingobium sp. AN641 TaxID=3133443 RepID=UPI0030BF053C
MPSTPTILLALNLLLMLGAGWRLFGIGWRPRVKIAAAAALVLPVPLLFLLPALRAPDRAFADLLITFGLTMLACGAACMAGGFTAAWLRARGR